MSRYQLFKRDMFVISPKGEMTIFTIEKRSDLEKVKALLETFPLDSKICLYQRTTKVTTMKAIRHLNLLISLS